jgi:phosphate transport system substrate-binding protein
VYAPPADSAGAQFFSERVLNGKVSKPVLDIRQLIFGGGGIGYIALGEARKLGNRQPILSVDSGGGCTAATDDSIRDGSYSFLSRPLYLYINRQSLRRSEVFRFVGYVLSKPGQEQIVEAGFIPESSKAFQDMQDQLDSINQER